MSRSRSTYTQKKGKLALDVLRKKKGAAVAAEAAGVTRKTLYNWRDEQPEFAAEWDAIQEGITDSLEESAIERAIDGDTTLLIFMLKSRRRETYGDKVQHSGDENAPLVVQIQRIVREAVE